MYNLHNLWARFIEVIKPSSDQLKIIKHQILEKIENKNLLVL